MANTGYPWWLAVYVPKGADRNVTNMFKITRVDRFQAQNKDMAFEQANRKQEWKLVSIAQEVMVVY